MKRWRRRPEPPAPAPPRPDAAPVEDTEALLRRLEWTVLRRLDGLLQGDWRTLLRGQGLDLADLREYQHHDDVRHIDWNVTARLPQPHVRVYTEDREMTAWFLLDRSASMDFGSGTTSKRAVAASFVAVLARLLTRHGNRVGAVLHAGPRDQLVPARGGRSQVLHLLHQARAPLPDGPGATATQLDRLLVRAAHGLPRRSTVFLVSDFISEPGWEAPLARLALRHEVVAVRVVDPLERALPDLGLIPLRDAESGEVELVDTQDPGFRARHAVLAARQEQALRAALAGAGVDTLELSTADDLAATLARFIDLRRQRRRMRAGAPATALARHLRAPP